MKPRTAYEWIDAVTSRLWASWMERQANREERLALQTAYVICADLRATFPEDKER